MGATEERKFDAPGGQAKDPQILATAAHDRCSAGHAIAQPLLQVGEYHPGS